MPKRFAILLLTALLAPFAQAAADAPDPDNIYNYHRVSDSLATAGQVFPVQVPGLSRDKTELVINLATADQARNGEEAFHVTSAGMSYVQIPVAWDNPTPADLNLFFAVMDARGGRRTLVHCFANYRASAFTFLYRVLREGVDEEVARADLLAIWDDAAFAEYPQWRSFINEALATRQ
ncbi:MAG: protein tyrosine phosphatase family protein [Pseudomonadota bacterium]